MEAAELWGPEATDVQRQGSAVLTVENVSAGRGTSISLQETHPALSKVLKKGGGGGA